MSRVIQSLMNSVEVQRVFDSPDVPATEFLVDWARYAMEGRCEAMEIVIRVVDLDESEDLNRRFRMKDGPTNILSFAYDSDPVPGQRGLLGDLVVCAPLVECEAVQQNKGLAAHWAHLLVHGVLHLSGFDHIRQEDAEIMEAEEIRLLSDRGVANPYEETAVP